MLKKKGLKPSSNSKKSFVKINNPKFKKDFICAKCTKPILPQEEFAILGKYVLTEKIGEILDIDFLEENFFHWKCWGDYINQKMINQQMAVLQNNPLIKNLARNIGLLKISNGAVTD